VAELEELKIPKATRPVAAEIIAGRGLREALGCEYASLADMRTTLQAGPPASTSVVGGR
jgi:hypothetical protein